MRLKGGQRIRLGQCFDIVCGHYVCGIDMVNILHVPL